MLSDFSNIQKVYPNKCGFHFLFMQNYNPQNPDLFSGVSVNVFFLISGFLNAYFGIATAQETGLIYVLLSIVFRWLR